MAAKNPHGLRIYDLLLDIIMDLSPYQAEQLYSELLARYKKRSRVKLYNKEGIEDREGKVRLMELQYKAIRTNFGDTFITRAFTELTNYIEYLENNLDAAPNNKQKLRKYKSGTHNNILTSGWVYEKCKQYIIKDRPPVINVNPFEIEDFNTAKKYIESIPKALRENAMDVKMLLMKFPELVDLDE